MKVSTQKRPWSHQHGVTSAGRGLLLRCALLVAAVAIGLYWLLDGARQHLASELTRWNRIGAIIKAELGVHSCADLVVRGEGAACLSYRTISGQTVSLPWLLVADTDGAVLGSAGDTPKLESATLGQILAPIISSMRKPDGRLAPDAVIAHPVKALSDERQTAFVIAIQLPEQAPRVLVGSVVTYPTDARDTPISGLLLMVCLGGLAVALWVYFLFRRTVLQPMLTLALFLRQRSPNHESTEPSAGSLRLSVNDHPIEQFIDLAMASENRCRWRETVLRTRAAQVPSANTTSLARMK